LRVPIAIGIALNFASTHQTENPRDTSEANWRKQFSEVGENKQLLIADVTSTFNYSVSLSTMGI